MSACLEPCYMPAQPKATDQDEFETLVDRTKRQAYNIAYRMTGNRDDAEDLTQEAYLRAYRSFSTYNRKLPFESWFFRILSNLFIDLMRRRPRQKALSLDQPVSDEDSDENLLLQVADEHANPERELLDHIMDERIETALRALPDPFRVAVLLCDVEGKTYEEIGEIMGSSIGTVRSRIHRGRTLLRKLIETPGLAKVRAARVGRRVPLSPTTSGQVLPVDAPVRSARIPSKGRTDARQLKLSTRAV